MCAYSPLVQFMITVNSADGHCKPLVSRMFCAAVTGEIDDSVSYTVFRYVYYHSAYAYLPMVYYLTLSKKIYRTEVM
jgi:hypothetical protein